MGKKNLMKEIKEMERKAREEGMASIEEAPAQDKPEEVDLDSWYFLRSKNIPGQHMKEIIRADFKARGLGNKDTMENFDKALESYGVKIK